MREKAWKALVVLTTTLVAAAVVATLFAEASADPTRGLSLFLAVVAVALAILGFFPGTAWRWTRRRTRVSIHFRRVSVPLLPWTMETAKRDRPIRPA